ncbi:nuclear transport factor 2 family protein [Pseudoxanthomonas winnipegensis]|uniref:nuclear transport factor 2 family protein n=1 Tax=Pseudoxanthomonas winnipegensis TaxID=2480810 RepID=UPI00257916E0|nr:nuclear transport factor 2 family protein [Pseudoxanthomonas winnipegensis]WJI16209.1 nuclear transport factor 2 family protein [Pseudoxanthomonas winnipegensis]
MKATILSAFLALAASQPTGAAAAEASSLQNTISALDTQVFDAFNRCQDPAQLARHAAYFDPAVEFYHDTGGVTWTRDAMLANTKQYACGRYTRQLVPGSLKVYPVKDFGAIEQGQHRFCQAGSQQCDGLADFVIIWRQHDGQWTITRVLSYGHRSQ